ncbi:MAG: DNA polymerase III subunit alpha [Anaerolineae bacterium]|nr:DNA polymerase III subunit alpha [Anaerolineae bacterium]
MHSNFTLLGALPPVQQLAAQAAADGMTALALTDRNALYGAVLFSNACRNVGIRPIIGLTLSVAADAIFSETFDLVLLARNRVGYQALCFLSSYLQAAPDREQRLQRGVPWAVVAEHTDGLVAIDGGRHGRLAALLRDGHQSAVHEFAGRLRDAFGRFAFVGVELNNAADRALAPAVMALAAQTGIGPVALQPVYTMLPQDRPTVRLLAAVRDNCRLDEVPDAALPDGGDPSVALHWLSPLQLTDRFRAYPEALETIGRIIDDCEPSLPDGRPIWPDLRLTAAQTPAAALAQLAEEGLISRYGSDVSATIRDRLRHELSVINRHGFAPLFIVVADIVRFARANGVPVSTRGSVANALVAYCTGITTVDPIEHDLLFERFLNPARVSLPDIDLDFCSRRRDRVLAYVRETYGADRMALVATVNTFKLKSAVRAVGKAYGRDEAALKQLARQLPRGWHPDPRRRETLSDDDLLNRYPDAADRAVVAAALTLVGRPDHLSVHPGGVVLTPGPLTDVVPLQWTAKGFVITQYDHRDVETIGLPKLDLLGIRALTVVADSAELIRASYPDFALDAIPEPDDGTAAILRRGATIGVFQCESTGSQRTLRQLKATTVRDLAVANAFFKPGPATGGMAAAFVRRYRGEEPVTFLHPALESILGSTMGVLLFQEQVLRVAVDIAGLSWEQANEIRRGISKFDGSAINALQDEFIVGCRRVSGFSNRQAEQLWQQVLPFAGYGFNQGHATAYAAVSYQSAYLKAHYPATFLCARLVNGGGYHHPAVYIAEARRLGIAVHPPHVNHSLRHFTLDERGDQLALWMGLGWVRDVRRKTVARLIAGRPFVSLHDLLLRVPMQAKEVLHLIRCGALDGLGSSRAALLAAFAAQQRAGNVRQMAFDFGGEDTVVSAESVAQRFEWEHELLGMPISVHPVDLQTQPLPDAVPLNRLSRSREQRVTVVGARLPGWSRSEFLFGDGTTFIEVVLSRESRPMRPRSWQLAALQGRWRRDAWGGGWLSADAVDLLT